MFSHYLEYCFYALFYYYYFTINTNSTTATGSTASHHSQQHNHRNHILTHCKTHHKPTKPNHNFNKTLPPVTTDQQISTARERNRSTNRRSPAPPRSLLRTHAPPRSCTTTRPPPDLQDDADRNHRETTTRPPPALQDDSDVTTARRRRS